MIADEILKLARLEIRDTQGHYDEQLRYYMRATVREIAKKFNYGPVEVTATITVAADGSFSFSSNSEVGEVVGIWDGVKRFDIVGPVTYQQRSLEGNATPTARIFQDAKGWHGQILQNATSATSVTAIYKTTTGDPAILPNEYEQHLIEGILAKYHKGNTKANPEVYYNYRDSAKQLLNEVSDDALRNTGEDLRIFGLYEVENQDALGGYDSLPRDVHL